MNKIKVIINPFSDSVVEKQEWVILKPGEEHPEYPGFLGTEFGERVTVEFNGKSYQLILDEDCPMLEIYDINDKEELILQNKKVFDLNEPGNTIADVEYEDALPGITDSDTFIHLEDEEENSNWETEGEDWKEL